MIKHIFTICAASLGALMCACVSVDKSVASSPSQFWNTDDKDAVPESVIEPERIKTEKIVGENGDEESDVKSAAASENKTENAQAPESADKKISGNNAVADKTSATGKTAAVNSSDTAKASDSAKKSAGSDRPLSGAEKLLNGMPLDLSEIVDVTLENNTQTRVYWFQAKNYAAALGKANAAYYPQVSVGAQIYRSKTLPSIAYWNIPGIGSYYETGYGPSAEINWLLYDFGKREAQVKSAREALRAANFDYNQMIQDVVLNVNVAYYDFYSANAGVESARLNLEDAETAYKSANARYTQGVGNKQDMLNALANAKNAEFSLEEAKASVETARANLANIMGIRVSPNLKLSTDVKIPSGAEVSQKIEELTAKALRSRQTLLAAYAKLRKTRSDVDIARRDFLPQISAQGTATYQWYTESGRGDQYAYQGGLNISWSIFEGFTRKYELINAKAYERAQAQNLKAAEIQIISDIWTYYHNYTSAVKQVASADAAVEANREAYEATKIGYEHGVNTITDFLNAQTRLATARQQKVSAVSTLSTSIARLAHATGSLLSSTEETGKLPSIPATNRK